jgi:uncharacterized membrane protein YfcA
MRSPWSVDWRIVAVGMVTGFLAGLLGIGAGAVTIFGLVTFVGFSQHGAHATSLAAIPAIALAGGLVFALDGNVDLLAALLIVLGAFLGVAVGSRIMVRLREEWLQRAFGLLMLAVAIRLLISA